MGICTKLLSITRFCIIFTGTTDTKLQIEQTEYRLSVLRSNCNQIRAEWDKYKNLKKNGNTSVVIGSDVINIDAKTKELSSIHNKYANQYIKLDAKKKTLRLDIEHQSSKDYKQIYHDILKQERICTNLYYDTLEETLQNDSERVMIKLFNNFIPQSLQFIWPKL